MPALQVKDCPVAVYDQLRLCADQEDRSISQQMLHILKMYLGRYQSISAYCEDPDEAIFKDASDGNAKHQEKRHIEKRKRLLESLRKVEAIELPKGFPTAAEMIREDRESRGVSTELQAGTCR